MCTAAWASDGTVKVEWGTGFVARCGSGLRSVLSDLSGPGPTAGKGGHRFLFPKPSQDSSTMETKVQRSLGAGAGARAGCLDWPTSEQLLFLAGSSRGVALGSLEDSMSSASISQGQLNARQAQWVL